MKFFPDGNTFFTVGGLSVRWYAVSLLIGIISAYLLMVRQMKKHGYGEETCDDLLILCMIAGMIGGRLFWVIEDFAEYAKYTPYIFAISDGGFDLLGMTAGILIAAFFYTRRRRMSFFRTADVLMPCVVLFGLITRTGRLYADPKLGIVLAMDAVFFLLLWFVVRPWHIGRRRGDVASAGIMLLGLERLAAYIFKLDAYAANILPEAIVMELFGFFLYIYIRRKEPRRPVILFDLDGTLMDSKNMVLQCFKYLFLKYGDPEDFTPEKQKYVFGPPLKETMKELFPDQDPDQMAEEYRKYQESFSWSSEVSLFPHTKETLFSLWQDGYLMGIVSSRMTGSCESWLRQLGLSFFGAICGRDLYEDPKPSPDGILYTCRKLKQGHDNCIYIGDNASDVEAAKAAGVCAIGFISDESKREEVENASPNYVISDISELEEILTADHEWSYERT